MKTIKLVFGLIMVLALISGSVVVAQEVDPPLPGEGWMQETHDPAVYAGVESPQHGPDTMIDQNLAETHTVIRDEEGNISYIPMETSPESLVEASPGGEPLAPEVPDPAPIPPPAEKQIDPIIEETDDTERIIEPVSGLIPIATASAPVWEYNPRVAHGGNYYMVAYVKDGDIYAAVFNNNGGLVNTHWVDNMTNELNVPKIAYHAPTGLFLVAYEYHKGATDYDIWIRAVSPTTGGVGGFWGITTSDDDEVPDVACAQTVNTCLVGWQRNGGAAIKGRYVTLGAGGITSASTIYNLSNFGGTRPFLAWGKNSGRYMLAYTWTNGSGVDFPLFTHIYQNNPGVDPYAHDAYYAIDFSTWNTYDKWATGVAYDPCTEKFVLLWDYDWFGNGSDRDILMSMYHNQLPYMYQYGYIAVTTADELSGDISFITDANLTAACRTMDKLGVIYTDWDNMRIYTTDLRGNSRVSGTHYTWDPKSKHLIVYSFPSGTSVFWRPSISGSAGRAQMFAAINYLNTLPSWNYNVYGRLVKSPAQTFIPTVFR